MNQAIEPNNNDILSGRGNEINKHPGNIYFRTVVSHHKYEYTNPKTTNSQKRKIVALIEDKVLKCDPPRRFFTKM